MHCLAIWEIDTHTHICTYLSVTAAGTTTTFSWACNYSVIIKVHISRTARETICLSVWLSLYSRLFYSAFEAAARKLCGLACTVGCCCTFTFTFIQMYPHRHRHRHSTDNIFSTASVSPGFAYFFDCHCAMFASFNSLFHCRVNNW